MSKVKYKDTVIDEDFYEEETEHRVLGWCESCGMEVLTGDDALKVVANGEHPEFFTKSADTREEY